MAEDERLRPVGDRTHAAGGARLVGGARRLTEITI
jgi:hypothetical protein